MSTVYDIVTERIVRALAAGVVPWRRPWVDGFSGSGPMSLSTGRAYQGCNRLLLSSAVTGYSSPWWGTYREIAARGGHVRKGERSSLCVYWTLLGAKKNEGEGDGSAKGSKSGRPVPLLRYFNVFNVEQCEGVEAPKPPAGRPFAPIAECERVVAGMPGAPVILHDGGGRCYYCPTSDSVHMTARAAFKSEEGYYATLFHELGHATGHAARLSRPMADGFGSKGYAREELVAELSSAFLCAECRIDTAPLCDNEAAYIKGWLSRLGEDNKLIVWAAGRAQLAADFILNRQAGEEAAVVAPEFAETLF
jgi:antirestriction protein ArdC